MSFHGRVSVLVALHFESNDRETGISSHLETSQSFKPPCAGLDPPINLGLDELQDLAHRRGCLPEASCVSLLSYGPTDEREQRVHPSAPVTIEGHGLEFLGIKVLGTVE
jgi:hypothetical protein